ncbi:15997_t:CDS:2, partial [Cetraspora pellucida]
PDARKDAKRLKEIQLTDDEWNLMKDLVNILGPFYEVTEKLDEPESYSDELTNEVNFETDDLAFDNDVGFTDAQEEEEEGSKKKKININTPTNIVNMRFRIKNALYNALLHYWDLSNDELLLAEAALRIKYNDVKSSYQPSPSSNRSSSSNENQNNQERCQIYQ